MTNEQPLNTRQDNDLSTTHDLRVCVNPNEMRCYNVDRDTLTVFFKDATVQRLTLSRHTSWNRWTLAISEAMTKVRKSGETLVWDRFNDTWGRVSNFADIRTTIAAATSITVENELVTIMSPDGKLQVYMTTGEVQAELASLPPYCGGCSKEEENTFSYEPPRGHTANLR